MRLGGSIRRRRSGGVEARNLFVRIAAGVVLVVAGFGGGYLVATEWIFPAPEPPEDVVSVPDLRGTALAEARIRIDQSGLVAGPLDSLLHPTLPAGTVVGQSPLPGQHSVPGDTVRVTVSLGPERRPVPDVSRLRGERARAVLDATGFRVRVDSTESSLPRGTVVRISPTPGTEVTLPSAVRLTVSLGPPRVRMPVLLGMSEEEALSALDSLGLVAAEIATRFRFGLDQGVVVEQEPPAGEMVERGSAVRIVVGARGPP